MTYNLVIELEQETDGRWIAEIPALPGVMAYGSTQSEAAQEVKALASRVLIDQENSCGAYPTARVIPFVEAFPAGSAVSPSRTGDRYSPFGVAPLKAGTGSRFRSRPATMRPIGEIRRPNFLEMDLGTASRDSAQGLSPLPRNRRG